ncbi:MAG: hypothetical protein QNI84_11460 [Henriciella sp.]|nr:hypothetical protein [Henriciella sp.]
MMRTLSITTALVAGATLTTAPASGQASESVAIDLTIQSDALITVAPPLDVSFSSDGSTASPASDTSSVCFETNLTDIRVTIATKNPPTGNYRTLNNSDLGDYVSYDLRAAVLGAGDYSTFNTVDQRDYDLSSATTGSADCTTSEFAFDVYMAPIANTGVGQARAISDVVIENGLDDGALYVFSDIITIVFEPIP